LAGPSATHLRTNPLASPHGSFLGADTGASDAFGTWDAPGLESMKEYGAGDYESDRANVLTESHDGHDVVDEEFLRAGLGLHAAADILAWLRGAVPVASEQLLPLLSVQLAYDLEPAGPLGGGDVGQESRLALFTPPAAASARSPKHRHAAIDSAMSDAQTLGSVGEERAVRVCFRPAPDAVMDAVARVFDAIPKTSEAIPRLTPTAGVPTPVTPLASVGHSHHIVAFVRKVVRSIVRRNLQDASAMLELYAPFEYLLSEHARLTQFLSSSPLPTLEQCEELITQVRDS
jgi:hypothetical protein